MEYSVMMEKIYQALVASALGCKPRFVFCDAFKDKKRVAMLGHPLCSVA